MANYEEEIELVKRFVDYLKKDSLFQLVYKLGDVVEVPPHEPHQNPIFVVKVGDGTGLGNKADFIKNSDLDVVASAIAFENNIDGVNMHPDENKELNGISFSLESIEGIKRFFKYNAISPAPGTTSIPHEIPETPEEPVTPMETLKISELQKSDGKKWDDSTKEGWSAFLGEEVLSAKDLIGTDLKGTFFYKPKNEQYGTMLIALSVESTIGNRGGVGWIMSASSFDTEGKGYYLSIISESNWDLYSIDTKHREIIRTAIAIDKNHVLDDEKVKELGPRFMKISMNLQTSENPHLWRAELSKLQKEYNVSLSEGLQL